MTDSTTRRRYLRLAAAGLPLLAAAGCTDTTQDDPGVEGQEEPDDEQTEGGFTSDPNESGGNESGQGQGPRADSSNETDEDYGTESEDNESGAGGGETGGNETDGADDAGGNETGGNETDGGGDTDDTARLAAWL